MRVPPQGGPLTGGNADKTGHDRQVSLHTSGCGYNVSGVEECIYVCPLLPEYRSPVYSDSLDTGDMSSGIVTAGSAGDTMLMEAGGTQFWKKYRNGNGTDRGVEGGRLGVTYRQINKD